MVLTHPRLSHAMSSVDSSESNLWQRVRLFLVHKKIKNKKLYTRIWEPTLQNVLHGVVDGSNRPQRFPSPNFWAFIRGFQGVKSLYAVSQWGKMSRKLPSRHRPCFIWLPHLALNSVWFFSLPYPTSKSTGVLIRETTCYIVKRQENKS